MDHLAAGLIDVKFASGGAKEGTFSGYGSIFGNIDSHGDVVQKGAFTRTLREWEGKSKLPKMLLQHGGFYGPVDDMLPIGKWTSMEENSKGLKVEGELFGLNTDRGALIYEGMKSGELDGLSIGYRAKKYTLGTKPTEPYRTLEDVDLLEVSVVLWGSNDKALVSQVKGLEPFNPRELERDLKSILSGADAVRAVAIVKKHLQREAEGHTTSSSRDEEAALELLDELKKLRAG
ncbi:HK97 family phage prohead protease [Rhizobium sp. NLR17b]|uniref:HK97 family phage prohead protease n=1 Tax=Rhizobium sp. NLR17b TaxID=2731114 RepID=UPI001C83DDD0|nr:HK97 family phage prohead protease [Rhizobium sp. NLR17b]MBX5268556.1 HK97 family phage prohead protease [Rhizobium sp. NLR17b]